MSTLEEGQARILEKVHATLEAAREGASKAEGWEVASRIEEMRVLVGYATAGDGCTDSIIVLGNWNTIDGVAERYANLPPKLCERFERLGAEIEWSDEWSECSGCYKAIRTEPDSYGWKPRYVLGDGEIHCETCVLEDPSSYLEGLEDNPDTCATLSVDPAEHGYVRIPQTFERGWYPGQADNPQTIAKALREMGITRFIFTLDSQGQFDARFSVHVHVDDIPEPEGVQVSPPGTTFRKVANGTAAEAILEALRRHGHADAVSPGELMAEALRSLPPAPAGDGIAVYKVSPEGSTVRRVSREDFINGRALD